MPPQTSNRPFPKKTAPAQVDLDAGSDDVQELQPERILNNFSRFPLATFFVISITFHVVLIFGTSVGYIRDHWIDPEGAKIRAEKEKQAADAAAMGNVVVPTKKPSTSASTANVQPKTDTKKTPAKTPETKVEGPMDKKLKELPKPDEKPPSLEDTSSGLIPTDK